MKMFVIPCDVNNQKVPVQFYIGEPSPFLESPIHFQRAWIKQERGVDVPNDVCDSLRKLKEISEENKVSFVDLCTYALNYPTESQQPTSASRKEKLFQKVRDALSKEELKFNEREDREDFVLSWTTDAGDWFMLVEPSLTESLERLVVRAILPDRVEERFRPIVAEYITRANYGLYVGNFEMDWQDGEVRFKTSLACEQPAEFVDHKWIAYLIRLNVRMVTRYLPGIRAVIFAGVSPEQAIKDIEAPNP